MVQCLLGLGSNLGDRVGNLLAALAELRQHPAIRIRRISSFLETAPVGGPADQCRYFNGAAVIETDLSPADLVAAAAGNRAQAGSRSRRALGTAHDRP